MCIRQCVTPEQIIRLRAALEDVFNRDDDADAGMRTDMTSAAEATAGGFGGETILTDVAADGAEMGDGKFITEIDCVSVRQVFFC